MSRVLLAVAIDDWGLGPLAAKEAAAMRLEPLGNVQVLKVKAEEDEQLVLTGPPREPSEAGRVGRGGARERAQFSPQAETQQSGLCDDDVSNSDTGKER